jgi:hypothetical protein
MLGKMKIAELKTYQSYRATKTRVTARGDFVTFTRSGLPSFALGRIEQKIMT